MMPGSRTALRLPDPDILAQLPHFRELSPAEIGEIVRRGTLRHWKEGDQVFRVGEVAERFFLLLDGMIGVVRTLPDGRQIIPLHIPAGEMFGIAVALGLDRYPATAVAASDCVTLEWASRLWPELSERYRGFSSGSGAQVGHRMATLHDRIEALTARSVEQRLAAALLKLVEQTGRPAAGGERIGIALTRATLSEMTGATLFTVSRVMSLWEKQGLVTSERRRVTICDRAGLAAIRDSGL